jgi:predicted PurR-regulated permease PerM
MLNPPRARTASSVVLPSATHAAILATVLVAALYFGRSVFVPLALAVLLSFVLSPLVVVLRRWLVPRALAVGSVVAFMVVVIAGLGMVMGRQVAQLGNDLPRYETTLREKLKSLRIGVAQSGLVDKATSTLKELRRELEPQAPAPASRPAIVMPGPDGGKPIPVEIHQPPERPLDTYQRIISVLLPPLTTSGIVLILIIFILLQREDIRDRVIRLVGAGDIEMTTAALDDAGYRLSRLFLAQAALNASFGVVIALGLWTIGVPSPILWGMVAALMRFIPYIGSVLSAVFPILLAASVDPGWSMVAWTLALFLILEPAVGHFIEPMVQGQTTGLSPLAIVVSAVLWTALWGPIGLLLATPLTMCLVVLGRHVEGLAFLDVILGDQPALSPPEVFYQRLLAGTSAEAAEQAEEVLKASSLVDYADDVALAGLKLGARDWHRGTIDEGRLTELRDGVLVLLEDLSDQPLYSADGQPDESDAPSQMGNGSDITEPAPQRQELHDDDLDPEWRGKGPPVLCLGARTPLDTAAADLLAHLLRCNGIPSRVAPVPRLTELSSLDFTDVKIVWISSIDAAQSHAQIRYVIRRLRRSVPSITICGGFWDGTTSAVAGESTGLWRAAATYAEAVDITRALARGRSATDPQSAAQAPVTQMATVAELEAHPAA